MRFKYLTNIDGRAESIRREPDLGGGTEINPFPTRNEYVPAG